MKKLILWLAILVIIAGLGVILAYYFTKTPAAGPAQQQAAAQHQIKPWVEVVRPSVFVLNPDDSVAYELQTGDEIDPGAKLRTNENGLANIYFPNGSVARMDVNSQITVSDASYNEENQSMAVKIILAFGRVWSKIFKLATPESSWEVDTTNAVATVRGTAFGVEFENGATNIVGSENEVAVSFIDPATAQPIKNSQAIITPGQVLAVNDTLIAMARKGGQITLPAGAVAAPSPVLTSEWVSRFKEADTLLEGKILPVNASVKYITPQILKQVIQGTSVSPAQGATQTVETQATFTISQPAANSNTTTSTTQPPTGAVMYPSSQTTTTTTASTTQLNTLNVLQPTSINLLNQTVSSPTLNTTLLR